MTTLPNEILRLVEQFDSNRAAYKSGQYNETQVRREFIDPFFTALDWDVENRTGARPSQREVVHEYTLRTSAGTKAPDYCFYTGSERRFFVEAKKPSVDLKNNPTPAFQVRRYGWSAGLDLSILTDFEEMVVYNCRVEPSATDPATVGQVLYLDYTQYLDQWPRISALFSKQAVAAGSLAEFIGTVKAPKGATVDAAFLKEISGWRETLAADIAHRNRHLNQYELNYAVQMTIDRILFLRICEARGIESRLPLEQLKDTHTGIYRELGKLFRDADDRYNSGLFHFSKERDREDADTFTLNLSLGDAPLHEILKRIYPPYSPYAFDVLPVEILGQVYEQFLGKVITLSPTTHQVTVEDKPEVRKAGGVYYTPTYIVDYIVKNTVGKLLEGKTPRQADALRILDPACGSGSFLIGAYSYLLNWHLDEYIKAGVEKRDVKARVEIGQDGAYRLTINERKRILLNNIYGVDIDTQAVEVTKLSLLLKVLEGETERSIATQLSLFQERALPDLANNIKCGNSLIGFDFYEIGQSSYLDMDEVRHINAFDWDAPGGFPQIMGAGGFDAVIGNPPYGADLSASMLAYEKHRFGATAKSYDSFELFLVQAAHLLKDEGRVSMIIPASWMTGDRYVFSRQLLTTQLSPIVAYAMPFDVFKDAYIDTAIVVFARSSSSDICLVHYFPKKQKLTYIPDNVGSNVPITNIRGDSLYRISLLQSEQVIPIVAKLESAPTMLGDWFYIQRGVQPYSRKKHSESQIAGKFLHASAPLDESYLPELQGNELSRYWSTPDRTSYLQYSDLLASSRPLRMFQGRRIVLRRLLTRKFRLQANMVTETMVTTDNIVNVAPKNEQITVEFVLGILNSRLISWHYANTSMIAQKDDFPQVHISALAAIRLPNTTDQQHDDIVRLVEQMLTLHKQLAEARTPQDKTFLQGRIDATDRQIDRLVYALYGLTDEEIRIVEENNK